MNGRSGKNNVEIKSGQQVCVVFFFFFFFFFYIAGPAFCYDVGRKGRNGDDFVMPVGESGGWEGESEGTVYHTLASS